MRKLGTLGKITVALDVFLGIETLENVPQEHKEQVIEFLQRQAKAIAQKQKEKEITKKIAEDRKDQRTKNKEEGEKIKDAIVEYLQANPNLLVTASELCENIPEFKAQGFKAQKLTRRLIALQEENKIKVVATSPKKVFQLK